MYEIEIFFWQFPNPWALWVSEMGFYTSKCEKTKIPAPYCRGGFIFSNNGGFKYQEN